MLSLILSIVFERNKGERNGARDGRPDKPLHILAQAKTSFIHSQIDILHFSNATAAGAGQAGPESNLTTSLLPTQVLSLCPRHQVINLPHNFFYICMHSN
jgi:hypothetical protein